MKSNLDVYAIQSDKEETKIALEKVKKDSLGNILYLNCRCRFKIGNEYVKSRIFDSCFYSEDSDIVIFFAKGKITQDEIEQYLNEMNIKYTIVSFDLKNNPFQDKDLLSEIWFAREKYVLEDAIDDSISRGIKKCFYYPNEISEISLGYKTNGEIRHYCEIEGRLCRGTIVFEDKIVLLVSQGDERNLTIDEAKQVLKDKGIKVEMHSKGR